MKLATESQSVVRAATNQAKPSTDKKPWKTPTVTESSVINITLSGFTGTGTDNGTYS